MPVWLWGPKLAGDRLATAHNSKSLTPYQYGPTCNRCRAPTSQRYIVKRAKLYACASGNCSMRHFQAKSLPSSYQYAPCEDASIRSISTPHHRKLAVQALDRAKIYYTLRDSVTFLAPDDHAVGVFLSLKPCSHAMAQAHGSSSHSSRLGDQLPTGGPTGISPWSTSQRAGSGFGV